MRAAPMEPGTGRNVSKWISAILFFAGAGFALITVARFALFLWRMP